MDFEYYPQYDVHQLPGLGRRNIGQFLETVLFFLDTGIPDLSKRAEGDLRAWRDGWVNGTYRVLRCERDDDGCLVDYVFMEVEAVNEGYAMKVLPGSNFLHKLAARPGDGCKSYLDMMLQDALKI
ncbi:MAG: hypothetical protein HGA85_09045 [Nanoarchaeota archaeon]|nr:hypothetical protein [Nanoarchaeota archaeon]